MWEIKTTDEYDRRHKRYGKKHPRELIAVLDNFDSLLGALREGSKLRPFPFGFLHAEPNGVIAIDQSGGGGNLAETRLYIFAEEDKQVLHVLTLGDKRSQREDIQRCREFVEDLRAKGKGDDER